MVEKEIDGNNSSKCTTATGKVPGESAKPKHESNIKGSCKGQITSNKRN